MKPHYERVLLYGETICLVSNISSQTSIILTGDYRRFGWANRDVKRRTTDVSEVKTPYLSMNGSFSQPEPPLGFIDSRSTATSFPFTSAIPPPTATMRGSESEDAKGELAELELLDVRAKMMSGIRFARGV